jgi:hypothetical protein
MCFLNTNFDHGMSNGTTADQWAHGDSCIAAGGCRDREAGAAPGYGYRKCSKRPSRASVS